MKFEAMENNLIGYLLDALEPAEKQQVEEHLRTHPETQARLELLRKALAPLAADAEQPEPPRQLAVGTLARIAEQRCRSLPPAPPPSRATIPYPRWLRRPDLAVAAALLILLGGLAIPWLLGMRVSHDIRACQNNLRQYGTALTSYAQSHDGKFPQVPANGYAANFVSHLAEAGSLPGHLACARPQSAALGDLIDDVRKLHGKPDKEDLFIQRARELAGNYAYSLGYRDSAGNLVGLNQKDLDERHPIMADHWLPTCPLPNSPNHGCKGENVLYVGGNVVWHSSPNVGPSNDNIYLNREDKVNAGVDADDAVLGSGDSTPLPRN